MAVLLWDASAVTKRYYVETGSDTIDALFAAAAGAQMVATFWGYAETYASLWRKRNRGGLTTLNPETIAAADVPALLATW